MFVNRVSRHCASPLLYTFPPFPSGNLDSGALTTNQWPRARPAGRTRTVTWRADAGCSSGNIRRAEPSAQLLVPRDGEVTFQKELSCSSSYFLAKNYKLLEMFGEAASLPPSARYQAEGGRWIQGCQRAV